MIVGYISETDPSREFHGYLDKKSSEKKIIRDVYEKGDKWFMTGMTGIKINKHILESTFEY